MYEGPERRHMDKDWVERDRLLTEVHSDVKHIVKWSIDHNKEDNDRFAVVTKEIESGKKILWGGVGIIGFLQLVSRFIK